MRLIDADALVKKFCVNSEGRRIPEVDCDNREITISIKDVKKYIREQPTAYDVEKVVEQEENFLINFGIPKDTKVHRKIIDIVKGGGAE